MNVATKSSAAKTAVNITGAHVLAGALQRHGVREIFGQSIPSALFLAAPDYGIRQIGYRTENAGAAMADAYARISGKVAVVTAQNGPAADPACCRACRGTESIDSNRRHRAGRQPPRDRQERVPGAGSLCAVLGRRQWVRRVADSARIDDYVDMAFTAAATGRCGPAVLPGAARCP